MSDPLNLIPPNSAPDLPGVPGRGWPGEPNSVMRIPCYSSLALAVMLAFPVSACYGAPATDSATTNAPAAVTPAPPDTAGGFSIRQLKALGIDPSVAAYLAQGARFQPGWHDVDILINGKKAGSTAATFNDQGELCADGAFMRAAGIRQPVLLFSENDGNCSLLKESWPTASVSPNPASQMVSVLVPPAAVLEDRDPARYSQTGTAALLNYSGYESRYRSAGGHSLFRNISLDGGVNVAGWMVRGARSFSQSSHGGSSAGNIWLYAQRAFPGIRKLFQVGQINFSNDILTGAPLDGIQLMPESGLNNDNGVSVSGIAPADQSRVEVRQNGMLILSTLVPPGPFTLNNLPVINGASDLTVIVTAPDGSSSSRTVPAASFHRRVAQVPDGYSLAVGRLRSAANAGPRQRPWVISLSNGVSLSPSVLLQGGGVVSGTWHGLGSSLNWAPLDNVSTGVNIATARDTRHHRQGIKAGVFAGWQMPYGLSLHGDLDAYTPGYRELQDSVWDAPGNYNNYSASLSAGWSHPVLGNFSLSGGRSRSGDRRSRSLYTMAGWSHALPKGTLSVNWQHQNVTTSRCDSGRYCASRDRDSLFINVSLPLGGTSGSVYYRDTDTRKVVGVRASGKLTENSNWALSNERVFTPRTLYSGLSGSLSSNLHYTTLGLYGSADSQHGRSGSLSLSGGMVVHREGVTFSPQKVSDTFGVVNVEPAMSGVEFSSPGGKTWTDWRGYAVVPSLAAWRGSRLEMNTERLPPNVDVVNGYRRVDAGHGAVIRNRFSLNKTRNVLLNVRLADGRLLPKGTAITDGHDNYVTTTVDEGMVFLSHPEASRTLRAELKEGSCDLTYSLPEKAPEGVGYEQLNARCR